MESENDAVRSSILAENIRIHAQEAAYYDRMHPEVYNRYEQNRIWRDLRCVMELTSPAKGPALDVGCGTGNLTLKLLAFGFELDAIDISAEMLHVLRQKCPEEQRIRLIEADLDTYLESCEQTYALICFSSVLHHLPNYLSSLQNSARFLSPGGVIYIVHEPLPAHERIRISPIIGWVGFLNRCYHGLSRRIFLRDRPRLDYTLSDYHVSKGISPELLSDHLARQGLNTHRIRRYYSGSTAFEAWLGNTSIGRPNLFALVAQERRMELTREPGKGDNS